MKKKGGSYVVGVEFVKKVNGVWVKVGDGEVTVDSAAGESVCPREWGGLFEMKEVEV